MAESCEAQVRSKRRITNVFPRPARLARPLARSTIRGFARKSPTLPLPSHVLLFLVAVLPVVLLPPSLLFRLNKEEKNGDSISTD